MIDFLRGVTIHSNVDHIVLLVGGVGLRVFTPLHISKQVVLGETLELYTHLVVKEDSLTLFGFESQDEVDAFVLILGCNGVGPRTALSILSHLSLEAIRSAVVQENPDAFARVPSVGKKTGQKIILHLQGKITAGEQLSQVAKMLDVDAEVMEALTSLGYSIVEAQAALQSIPRETEKSAEVRLRLALQYFSN
jgi:Holliday junction DNA helicase RuvA